MTAFKTPEVPNDQPQDNPAETPAPFDPRAARAELKQEIDGAPAAAETQPDRVQEAARAVVDVQDSTARRLRDLAKLMPPEQARNQTAA